MNFKQAVSESNVAFMVGTGVSAFTTNGAPTATWYGLIKDGANRAVDLNPSLNTRWMTAVKSTLEADMAVAAAGMVAQALKALGEKTFADWLQESVGALQVRNSEVAEALLGYPFPILTTNYDTLLEEVGDRASTNWTDPGPFHNSLTRETKAIAHLHGIWSKPDSVVLTEADYQRVLSSESTQYITRALSTLKSIVYVGFGAGMDDPNFSALRAWRQQVFPNSGTTHYRLCRAGEEHALRIEHSNENVTPVVYGEAYDDLASFLREHSPKRDQLVINDAGLARDVIEDARVQLRESMMNESVLMEAGAADFESRDLILPPVFLPMPHSNFVQAQMGGGEQGKVAHIDGSSEVRAHDFFVVVGDEGSGLTTALKWLAAESSAFLGSVAPVFVRYSECRVRKAPLQYAISNAAKQLGLIQDKNDSLPDYVLALDDFSLTSDKVSQAVLAHLATCSAFVKIVGCAQGEEEGLVSRLADFGIKPRVLYLGRMRRGDIQSLAEKIAPGDGRRLTHEVVRVLDAEGLQRNPMTVSLLLYLVHRNAPREVLNQTSLVDAYLSILLVGIGDPQDSLGGLSETDIEAILAALAEKMVRDETPSVSEAHALANISDTQMKYGWDGTAPPSEVLHFLLRRRILRRHGSMVEFGRYSYLTLFAAKRATVSSEFHEIIVGDIFYYAPLAKRLAALTRTDEVLFGKLGGLLSEELASEPIEGLPFELVEQENVSEEPEEAQAIEHVDLDESEFDDEIELPESDSPGSFGLVKSEMTTVSRMSRSVRLASRILRDLDQIERLEEKRKLLVMTLEVWGRLITAFSSDPLIKELEKAVLRDLEVEGDAAANAHWRDFVARSIPAGTAFGGMEADLVSPKLSSTLNDAYSRGELTRSPELIVAALFFLLIAHPNGWVTKARALVNVSEPTWILSNFFHALCEDAYARRPTPGDDLLELCKTLFEKRRSFSSPAIRSAHMDVYLRRLRTLRAQVQRGV